ncbi:hypothetical protein SFRURICE_012647 [Spodoptera frugiperda]|nr:hypothetical protein SFRURICE_012647 [Spodoptera frugiperda]
MEMVTNRGTQMLMADGFRFSKSYANGRKIRWQCSTRSRTKCSAFMITMEGHILRMPVFSASRYGNPMIELGPYRFTRSSVSKCGRRRRWVCASSSKQASGCRAAIFTLDDVIVRTTNEHQH